MLLTKSCYAEHHILRGGTLQLATHKHYRTIEVDPLRDTNEGRLFFDLDIRSPVSVEKKWFNTLFQRSIGFGDDTGEAVKFPGFFEAKVTKQLRLRGTTSSHAIIESGRVSMTREAVSSLVFCMSESAAPGDCRDIFPHYNDEWSINTSHLSEFISEVVQAIFERLLAPNEKPLIPQHIDPREIKIHMDHMPVFYADRNISITEKTPFDINNLMKSMAHTAFIKPASYQREREYRFNFVLVHNDRPLDLLLDTILIEASDRLMRMVR